MPASSLLCPPARARSTLSRLTSLAGDLPALPGLSPERYAAGHAAFELRSTQRASLTGRLAERLTTRAGDLRVLSVGCGDGQLDAALAGRAASAPGRAVAYDGLEPHPTSAASFLARVGGVDGVDATARVGRAESLRNRRGYHVVLCVHALYYVDDLAAAVGRLLDAVAPGGELVLALAPRADLNQLAAALAPELDGHRQWWADGLDAVLARLPLQVRKQRVPAVLDLQDCLDPSSGTGQAVLDFAVQALLPNVLREPVLAHLASVRLPGARLQVDHPVELWTVRKA